MSDSILFPGQKDVVNISLDMMKVLASSATYEVFLCFSFVEPRSIPDVATELGKSQATIGSHVTKLLEQGLLVQTGLRKKRSRMERLFVWTGRGTYHDYTNQPREYFKATSARTESILRRFARQYSLYMDRVFLNADDINRGAMRWRPMIVSKEGALRLRQALFDVHEIAGEIEQEAKDGIGTEFEHVFMITTFMPTVNSSNRRLRELRHQGPKKRKKEPGAK